MIETIKDYLVSLGFAVDKSSYNEATKAMDEAGHSVAKFAGSAVTQFATAGVAVVSFAVTASIGIAKFLDGLGKAAIENEKLARQMWTTEQNAMAFSATLKAMGVTLQDLYLSPTLMSQFQELRSEANSLRPPSDYKNQMQLIQSVTFEFTRMKLEATYALQWIGYYFTKYMGGPIRDIKNTLNEINGIIVKRMPHWTKTVAQVMSWFAQFGITTVRAIKDVMRVFDEIGQGIPRNIKLIGGALAALGLIIETGPLGILIAIFTAAILLLNDFYTYLDGGESAFGPFWKKLQDSFGGISDTINTVKKNIRDFFSALQDGGTIDNFKNAIVSAGNSLQALGDAAFGSNGWVQRIYDTLKNYGDLSTFTQNIIALSAAVRDLSSAFNQLLSSDTGKNALYDIGTILKETVIPAFEYVNDLMKGITHGFEILAKAMKGDWGGVLDEIKTGLGDFIASNAKRAIQDHNNLVPTIGGQTWGPDGKPLVYGPPAPSYMYPSSTTHNNQKSSVSLSQTNNIYGSDPKATANQAQNNFEDMMYLRNFSGVTR